MLKPLWLIFWGEKSQLRIKSVVVHSVRLYSYNEFSQWWTEIALWVDLKWAISVMNFRISFIFRICKFINGTYIEAYLWTFPSGSKLVSLYIHYNLCMARSANVYEPTPVASCKTRTQPWQHQEISLERVSRWVSMLNPVKTYFCVW